MKLKPRIRIFFFFILLVASCGKKEKLMDNTTGFSADSLISETKMVCIMSDVHIIEAALLIERNEGIVSKEKTSSLYDGIFKKYHLNRAKYEYNLMYYSQNPESYSKLYGKVIGQLETQQKSFSPKN